MTRKTSSLDYPAFTRLAPDAHAALLALGKAVDDGGLDKRLSELVKLRVSQINGCAFCVQFHLNVARKLGVEAAKLDLVTAWRDAGLFCAREQAALAWAERLTSLDAAHGMDQAYRDVLAHFSEREAILLTAAIGAINAWNRLGVGLGFPPPRPN